LDKYKDVPLSNGQVLPVPTNQKMNAYLHEIADVCGINKVFTCHAARHTIFSYQLQINKLKSQNFQ
jgi:integrase